MCMMNPTGIRVFCNIDIDIQNTNFRWCFERSNRIWCVAIRIEWPLVDIQMWILDNRGKRAKKIGQEFQYLKRTAKWLKQIVASSRIVDPTASSKSAYWATSAERWSTNEKVISWCLKWFVLVFYSGKSSSPKRILDPELLFFFIW